MRFAIITPLARLLTPAIVILFAGLWAASAQPNIVQNGGFSSPNGTVIPGWTYDGYIYVPGYPDAYGTDGPSFLGVSFFLEQTLNTLPGQSYLLKFDMRDDVVGNTQIGPNGIHAYWGPQDLGIFPLVDGSLQWVNVQLPATAVGTQTTLRFSKAYPSNPYIDGVSVVAVPEPAAATCLLLGLSALLVQRYRFALVISKVIRVRHLRAT